MNPLIRPAFLALVVALSLGAECDAKVDDFFRAIEDDGGTPQFGTIVGQVTVNGQGRSGISTTLLRGATTVTTTATGAGGNYQFTDVEPNTYTVAITQPPGVTCPTTQQNANVQANQTTTVNFTCSEVSTIPTGAQIQGGYSLTGTFSENTCSAQSQFANLFPAAGSAVTNPGPINFTAQQVKNQTIITGESDTDASGALNTQTGDWTGTGRAPLSGTIDIVETISGRWQRDSGGTILLNTNASVRFDVIDNRGTPGTTDDVVRCTARIQPATYRRLN